MNINPLLDFIRSHEAPKGYDQVWGGIAPSHRPKKPLTTMTVQQVLDWQDSIDRHYRSEAAGAYQVLEDTLRDHYHAAGLALTERFDRAAQDRFAVYLIKRRGLGEYISGQMTAVDFANRLAREWASLPLVSGPNRGRSYYAGDGLNRSLTSADEFLRVVRAVRDYPPRPDVEPAGPSVQKMHKSPGNTQKPHNALIAAIVTVIAALAAYLGVWK